MDIDQSAVVAVRTAAQIDARELKGFKFVLERENQMELGDRKQLCLRLLHQQDAVFGQMGGGKQPVLVYRFSETYLVMGLS